jgi:hypothetical protein
MKIKFFFASVAAGLFALNSTQAQIVYDNLSTSALSGYSGLNSDKPVFGDSLTLASGGVLGSLGLSLYNSSSGGNTGSILTGSMLVNFYDNTTPYAGGVISNPLLGSATVDFDFTADGGLGVGFYDTETFDLSAQNINLTQNILITQQFTELTGTSLRNGIILFGNPTVGSSPSTVYISSASVAPGLYTFSGNPGQFGYQVTLVPEPTTLALASLGGIALGFFRRRK